MLKYVPTTVAPEESGDTILRQNLLVNNNLVVRDTYVTNESQIAFGNPTTSDVTNDTPYSLDEYDTSNSEYTMKASVDADAKEVLVIKKTSTPFDQLVRTFTIYAAQQMNIYIDKPRNCQLKQMGD